MMTAKYPGTCRACGGTIRKGESIAWNKSTGAQHARCAGQSASAHQNAAMEEWIDDPEKYQDGESDEDDSAGLERGTLANDRRLARNGLSVTCFASGAVMTQNSRGRCEDAPCCGCCS